MTHGSAFESPRKHMQAMEGRSGRLAEKRRITNGTGRCKVKVRREDNRAAKLAFLGSVRCLRSNRQYRAKRFAEDCFSSWAEHEALKAMKGIRTEDSKIDLLRCDRF